MGWAFHEVVKEETTPPPPTAEEWAAMPSTPSDIADDPLAYREWAWENRPPNAGGRPTSPDPESSSSAGVSLKGEDEGEEEEEEEEKDDDIDEEDEAVFGPGGDDFGDGEEDEAWHMPATSSALKRDATHFSPQKGAAEPKKRKGTSRGKILGRRRQEELKSTILKVPPQLARTREAVFSLHAGQGVITWTPAQWEQLWPFVDNIWVRNKERPMTKNFTQVSYYWCRLYKNFESAGTGQRSRQLRSSPPCGMKLKVMKKFSSADTSQLESVDLLLHNDDKKPCFAHNHSLDYSDSVKINSHIMDAAGEQVGLGYEPAHIHRVLTGVKWTVNLEALKAAGDIHLSLKDVHNAGIGWRRAHPDLRQKGAKVPWEEQRQELLDGLKGRDDVVSANIEAVRNCDGETTYATAFANKSKSKRWWW